MGRSGAPAPPRLLVTGRLSYILSAFGEHLTGEEIEAAAAAAAAAISAGVRDFAAGALYPENPGEIGGHLFVLEFERAVSDAELARFAETLDRDLMRRNLDYEAHRPGGDGPHPPPGFAPPRRGFAPTMQRPARLPPSNNGP